jgi:cleavage and polyadenylation specificity factor subunit 2
MGRVAVVDELNMLREEQDFGSDEQQEIHDQAAVDADSSNWIRVDGKRIAALKDVQEAFDSFNTLRYSQPTHLQGSTCGTLRATI